MTDKPILTVPLDTSAFDAFREKFRAYQEKLKETPRAWGEAAEKAGAASSHFDDMAERMANTQSALARMAGLTKDIAERESESVGAWARIGSSAKSFGAHIGSASLTLARWTGLTAAFSSLLSAGGLWGIGRMAAGVSMRRTSAMGYGLSYGEAQAYQTNFARLGNSGGLLAGFNEAMTSAEARAPLYTILGPDADKKLAGKSAAVALADALPSIKRFVMDLDPRNMQNVLRGTGADRLGIDVSTANTIRALPMEEIEKIAEAFRRDSGAMDLPPDVAQAWQTLETQLHRAGTEIETHFAEKLANIAPAVEHLSHAATHFIDTLLKDGGAADKGLKRLGGWLDDLSHAVGKPEFLRSVESFAESVGRLGSVLIKMGITGHSAPGSGGSTGSRGREAGDSVRSRGDHGGDVSRRYGATPTGVKDTTPYSAAPATPRDSAPKSGAPRASTPRETPQAPDMSPWHPDSAARVEMLGGRRRDGDNPSMMRALSEGSKYLPPGYKMRVRDSYTPHGHTSRSQHKRYGNPAVDFDIVDDQGRVLPSIDDRTGLYERVKQGAYFAALEFDRPLAMRMASGHDFSPSGSRADPRRDDMHIDERGGYFAEKFRERAEANRSLFTRRAEPPEHRGKVNRLEIEDHSGGAIRVESHSHAVGPNSGGDIWRFGH